MAIHKIYPDQSLRDMGYENSMIELPWENRRLIRWRKGIIIYQRREKYLTKRGFWQVEKEETFIAIPGNTPWDPKYALEHITDIADIEKLDKLINT